jgi:signal recognition particle subunit SRP68
VQFKADNANSQTYQARWRLHSARRFAKAAYWAEFLEKQCTVHADQRTQREAEAYTAFMMGTVLLEKESWAEALDKLQRCKKVCEQLALASDPAEAKLFKDHIQELVPAIRECKYKSGKRDMQEDGDEDLGPISRSGGLEGLEYRGHGLASPSDKIKEKLTKCLQLAKDTKVSDDQQSAAVIEKYGEVVADFSDLLNDIHADMITSKDLSEDEWRLIEAFAREMSICLNIERNLVLLWNHLVKLESIVDISSQEARKTCRPEEGMRFCDLLKEDLENLRDLPKTSSGISDTLTKYQDVAKNCRCLFLALCQILLNKPLESAALFEHLHNREECEVGEVLEEPLDRLHARFEQIAENLPNRVTQWRCRGLAQLCGKQNAKAKEQDTKDSAAAASFPPRVKDIPCKPLLFDLAFPCIEPPDFDERNAHLPTQELLPKNRASQGGADGQKGPGILGRVAGGIGSRLGGLWGRGQK